MQPAARLRTQLLIRFGYDGARFSGLQPQGPLIPTAGYALKLRLTEAAGEPPKGLNFAARTDAGVHAESNVATCWWRERPVEGLLERIGGVRNDGLINVEAAFVPPEIHARGSARGKLYRYVVEDGVPGEIDAAHAHAWRIGPTLRRCSSDVWVGDRARIRTRAVPGR